MPESPLLKGILFDFDGTIVHTETFSQQAVKAVFEKHLNVTVDEDELRAHTGIHYRDRFIQMLAMRGIDDDTIAEELEKQADKYFHKDYDIHQALVPGIKELLELLTQEKITLAIVSSSSRDRIIRELTEVNIIQYFECITGAEDVRVRKPHPEPYAITMEKLGLLPEETMAFEDSPPGIESATLAGLHVIGLLTTFYEEDLGKASKTIRDYEGLTIADIQAIL